MMLRVEQSEYVCVCVCVSVIEDVHQSSKYYRFECPECKRECSSQAKLTAHRRTHNAEKSFKCSIEVCYVNKV